MIPRVHHRHLALACFVAGLVTSAFPASAAPSAALSPPTDEALFANVFKRPDRSDRVPVVLVIDGVFVGQAIMRLRPGAAPLVPAEPLFTSLAPRLRAELRPRLQETAHGGQVSLDDLRALGLDVEYEKAELELRVFVPAALTEEKSHSLRGNGAPPEAAGALRPSDVSGFLNARAGGADTWTTGDAPTSRVPLHLNLDSALSVGGWLLEGKADFADAPMGAHRGDVLLSRDDPESALRYLAGDFAVQPTALQPSYPLLGLGVTRNFALQPYRVIQPIGEFDFTLEQPSTVTVLVNGAPVRTLSLPAGRHDVRDLPLGPGVNDVELLIQDPAGVQRRIAFSSANPGELLAPGVVQYAVNLGAPLVADVGARDYAWTRPVLSARRRWGALPMLTVGASFDGDLERQRAGGELTLATTLGTLSLDMSASADTAQGLGHAESARYDYARVTGGTRVTTFTVVGRHHAAAFRTLGPVAADELYGEELTISASHRLPGAINATVSGRYRVGRAHPDAQDASLRLSRSFGLLSVDGMLSAQRDGVSPDQLRVLVGVRVTLPDAHGTVFATARTSTVEGTSSEAVYTTQAGPPPGGIITTVSVQENPESVGASGTVSYVGNRLTSSVSTTTALDTGGAWATQTTALELGTGLAFAGGEVGWSRPVADSFVIVARNPTVAAHDVEVNPALGGYAARADGFGPAVLPNLEPYRVTTVVVRAPTLPTGYSLGSESHVVLPAHKTGTLLRVGEEGTVFLRGSLQHADGKPVAFATGEVTPVEGSAAPLVLMTNRAGRFSLVGLRPGRYELRLSDGASKPLVIEIPNGTTGLHSTGALVVE
jgi:outer membrane usher protein